MNFKIVKDNKKSIRERSQDIVFPLSNEIKELGLNMLNYLKLSQDEEYLELHKDVRSGVGLAAPQIGQNIKLIAIYCSDENGKQHEYILINPIIISESTKQCFLFGGEGCLSVDDKHPGLIYRSYKIKVKCFDLLKNENKEYTFTGYLAIVAQHEIDHLKGILFYDHINKENPFEIKKDAIEI